jgi:hypothetical protein
MLCLKHEIPDRPSYPESLTIDALLELANAQDERAWLTTPLDYPPLRGGAKLMQAISTPYRTIDADHLVSFSGGDEALYAAIYAGVARASIEWDIDVSP